jgi:hypothetical protein
MLASARAGILLFRKKSEKPTKKQTTLYAVVVLYIHLSSGFNVLPAAYLVQMASCMKTEKLMRPCISINSHKLSI